MSVKNPMGLIHIFVFTDPSKYNLHFEGIFEPWFGNNCFASMCLHAVHNSDRFIEPVILTMNKVVHIR
jgi:hypothetical protein